MVSKTTLSQLKSHSPFVRDVLTLTCLVPKGKVVSYADIARTMGKRSYRAVGTAMSQNNIPMVVPCHRVVKSDGKVGGFMGDANDHQIKSALLVAEGVEISNDRILDFDKKRYSYSQQDVDFFKSIEW